MRSDGATLLRHGGFLFILLSTYTTLNNHNIIVRLATSGDHHYAETITTEMEESAKARGTGIAKRSPDYIRQKMDEGKSIIALTREGEWVGFCYIEAWEHEKYVANSGLIVSPSFRKTGIATEIKHRIFELSRQKYPHAKIFGLTTGLAVMKINSDLGYEPVTYSELTTDEEFWKGCKSCINYEILTSKNRKNCLCTAMLFDPVEAAAKLNMPLPPIKRPEAVSAGHNGLSMTQRPRVLRSNVSLFERWLRFKQFVLLKAFGKREEQGNETRKRSILSFFYFW